MSHLISSLLISFTLITITSPCFAGDDHNDKMWGRDKTEKQNDASSGKPDADIMIMIEELVDALVVCPSNTSTRFVDNGDDTICDSETGLMWEKKNAEDDVADYGNPQDVDNLYTWTADNDDYTVPDGTAFTDFLARLNGVIALYSLSSAQLGGYSDWRLPTIAELQTIVDCNFSPCIDPIFGPIATDYDPYFNASWSTTSHASEPITAFNLRFSSGMVDAYYKMYPGSVRAVRGGR